MSPPSFFRGHGSFLSGKRKKGSDLNRDQPLSPSGQPKFAGLQIPPFLSLDAIKILWDFDAHLNFVQIVPRSVSFFSKERKAAAGGGHSTELNYDPTATSPDFKELKRFLKNPTIPALLLTPNCIWRTLLCKVTPKILNSLHCNSLSFWVFIRLMF